MSEAIEFSDEKPLVCRMVAEWDKEKHVLHADNQPDGFELSRRAENAYI